MFVRLKNRILSLLVVGAIFFFFKAKEAKADFVSPIPFQRGYSTFALSDPETQPDLQLVSDRVPEAVNSFCHQLKQTYLAIHSSWTDAPCGQVSWNASLRTPQKHPLLWTAFGNGSSTTLFLGGVHPDEITPIHLAFRFARHLQAHPELYENLGIRIIVAPLVNPDGFLGSTPLRTNGLVDLNRNFLTQDWYESAHSLWRDKRNSHPDFFPGFFPNSEVETYFQLQLISMFQPAKIFSLHAPLGFLDYDGPSPQTSAQPTARDHKASQFVYAISRKSQHYPVRDYSFYPGSLGNFAGNERSIPTITLELESARATLVEKYWSLFLPAFLEAAHYRLDQ